MSTDPLARALPPTPRLHDWRLVLIVFVGFLLPSSSAVLATTCGDNSPAVPVPQWRDGVRLWPEIFRPARPGQTLPNLRDSTDRLGGLTEPSAARGHELFKAIQIRGETAFVAYSLGIQAWNVGPNHRDLPKLLTARDLWKPGDFLVPPPGNAEQFHYINDIDAWTPSAGGSTIVAAAGKMPFVGPTIWSYDSGSPFTLHYQDAGDGSNGGTNAVQGALVELAGRVYYVAAGGMTVTLYDATAATELDPACLDDRGANAGCGSVWLGTLPQLRAGYVDARVVDDRLVLALGGMGDGIQLVELRPRPDGSLVPDDVTHLASTGSSYAAPVAIFDHDGRSWLALGDSDRVEIHDISGCIEGTGCAFGDPEWQTFVPFLSDQFLTASSNRGIPYLYYGINAHTLDGAAIERLFDLRSLGRANTVTEVTAGGGSVLDPCSGGVIDYWSAYYGGNTDGLRGVEPRQGVFHHDRFYRVAETIFDVHVIDDPSLFIDGFESGTTQGWSSSTP